MRSVHRAFTGLFIVPLLAACSDALPTEEPGLAPSGDPAGSVAGSGLPMYGLGGFVRATPGEPCAEPSYEEFDFWVGEWDVFNPACEQVGTNSVRKELDGCVVSESWTVERGSSGTPGTRRYAAILARIPSGGLAYAGRQRNVTVWPGSRGRRVTQHPASTVDTASSLSGRARCVSGDAGPPPYREATAPPSGPARRAGGLPGGPPCRPHRPSRQAPCGPTGGEPRGSLETENGG